MLVDELSHTDDLHEELVTPRVHDRKKEENVTLVYHPSTKFSRTQICIIYSACSQQRAIIMYLVAWTVGVCIFIASVLAIPKGREVLPGMVYSSIVAA